MEPVEPSETQVSNAASRFTSLPATAVIGDSFASKRTSDGGDGWSVILDRKYPGLELKHFGRGGTTAKEWADQIGGILRGSDFRKPEMLLISLGGNDWQKCVHHSGVDGVYSRVESKELKRDLRRLYTLIRRKLSDTLLVHVLYPDAFDRRSKKIPRNASIKGRSAHLYRNNSRNLLKLNAEIREVVAAFNGEVVEMHDRFMEHGISRVLPAYAESAREPYFLDVKSPADLARYDYHPNSAGHQAIADCIEQKLLGLGVLH